MVALALNCHLRYISGMKTADRDKAFEVLRNAAWLKHYPTELAERLLAEGRLVRLGEGEWAQAEGDERSGLFVVIAGVLHTYCEAPGGSVVMIGLARAGSVLGHATRFSGGPRHVTAVCVEPCVLLEISEAALERVAEGQSEVWQAIAEFTYINMRNVLRMAAEVIALRPRQRLAARLLAAGEEDHTAENPVLKISQELLAEMIGVSRKTVNVHLSAFERGGIVKVSYGRIVLKDMNRLRMIANA